MATIMDKIKSIEEEMVCSRGSRLPAPSLTPPRAASQSKTQKNKATSGHLGMLKARARAAAACPACADSTRPQQAKLAKLRREILEPSKGAGAGKGEGFDVTKAGDSRVGLVGACASGGGGGGDVQALSTHARRSAAFQAFRPSASLLC